VCGEYHNFITTYNTVIIHYKTSHEKSSSCTLISTHDVKQTFGGQHWTTRSTSGISSPRAATSVAIRHLYRPSRKPWQ